MVVTCCITYARFQTFVFSLNTHLTENTVSLTLYRNHDSRASMEIYGLNVYPTLGAIVRKLEEFGECEEVKTYT
jgi:hypothetical protein